MYSVVINCGWNNNVAVKIVACWNRNVFSSWLDRHSEFVFTVNVDVINLIVTVLSDRPSFEWECYRLADLVSSVKVNLFDMFPCCCCSEMAWMRCCLRVWQKDGGRCSGRWLKAVTSSDITFYGSHKGSWKGTATLCRLCELYCEMTVLKVIWKLHIPLDLTYHERSQEISVLTIWNL